MIIVAVMVLLMIAFLNEEKKVSDVIAVILAGIILWLYWTRPKRRYNRSDDEDEDDERDKRPKSSRKNTIDLSQDEVSRSVQQQPQYLQLQPPQHLQLQPPQHHPVPQFQHHQTPPQQHQLPPQHRPMQRPLAISPPLSDVALALKLQQQYDQEGAQERAAAYSAAPGTQANQAQTAAAADTRASVAGIESWLQGQTWSPRPSVDQFKTDLSRPLDLRASLNRQASGSSMQRGQDASAAAAPDGGLGATGSVAGLRSRRAGQRLPRADVAGY